MPTLLIDTHHVTVPEGATLLAAARAAGVALPTLCHDSDLESHQAGCMVCVVEDLDSGNLLPACVAPAREGARIATNTTAVHDARRQTLAMLLSDHPADCEAPCQLGCPCRLEIPALLQALAQEDSRAAWEIIHRSMALPSLLCRVCSAPCEKVCRRATLDEALAIRSLQTSATAAQRPVLERAVPSGKRVTIVGAGPTGLAAAFFLQRRGHACLLIESRSAIGGALPEQRAEAAAALALDWPALSALGAVLRLECRAGETLPLATMAVESDAIVLACGEEGVATLAAGFGVACRDGFVAVASGTFQTNHPHIFAAGGAIRRCRLAATANGQGRALAAAVDAWLHGRAPADGASDRFRSRAGRLEPEELATWAPPEAPPATRRAADNAREAARCLRCDCRRAADCRLREACQAAGVQGAAARAPRRDARRIVAPGGVVVEHAKCIVCGICVRLTRQRGDALGLAFIGRGFDVRIGPPAGYSWNDLSGEMLRAAAAHCPTGALSRM